MAGSLHLTGLATLDDAGMLAEIVSDIVLPLRAADDDTPCPREDNGLHRSYIGRWMRCRCYTKSGKTACCMVR